MHFNRSCTSLNIKTLDDLKNLVVLEQFENSVTDRIATYINEHKVQTAYDAAILADEFVLTHTSTFGQTFSGEPHSKESSWHPHSAHSWHVESSVSRLPQSGLENVCHYCHASGHWKNECPVLKAKSESLRSEKETKAFIKSVGLVSPVLHLSWCCWVFK